MKEQFTFYYAILIYITIELFLLIFNQIFPHLLSKSIIISNFATKLK